MQLLPALGNSVSLGPRGSGAGWTVQLLSWTPSPERCGVVGTLPSHSNSPTWCSPNPGAGAHPETWLSLPVGFTEFGGSFFFCDLGLCQ